MLALMLSNLMVAHKAACQTFERFLEVHEDVIKVLLVLRVFLKEYSKVENLLCSALSCSETCLFFFDYLLSLWLQAIWEDSQHDLTWMMPFLKTCWLASLYSFATSSVFFFCLSCLRLSHSFSVSSVTQSVFVGRCFAKDVIGCFGQGSVAAVDQSIYFGVVIVEDEKWSNFLPVVTRKFSAMFGSLSFSRLNLILTLPCFFILWRRSLKVIISSAWPMSAPGKLLVFAMLMLDWKRRFAMM